MKHPPFENRIPPQGTAQTPLPGSLPDLSGKHRFTGVADERRSPMAAPLRYIGTFGGIAAQARAG